jgi:hypothetical protein
MLAATDAALGKAVITNKAVPVQILEGGYKRSFDLKKRDQDSRCKPYDFLSPA